MAETKGVRQFEVEIQKYKKLRTIELRISLIRGPRGKKKLLGEAYAKSSEQPAVYFKVVNAEDEASVYHEFLRLLVWRGYLPIRGRSVEEGKWTQWKAVPLDGIDGIEQVLKHEGQPEEPEF